MPSLRHKASKTRTPSGHPRWRPGHGVRPARLPRSPRRGRQLTCERGCDDRTSRSSRLLSPMLDSPDWMSARAARWRGKSAAKAIFGQATRTRLDQCAGAAGAPPDHQAAAAPARVRAGDVRGDGRNGHRGGVAGAQGARQGGRRNDLVRRRLRRPAACPTARAARYWSLWRWKVGLSTKAPSARSRAVRTQIEFAKLEAPRPPARPPAAGPPRSPRRPARRRARRRGREERGSHLLRGGEEKLPRVAQAEHRLEKRGGAWCIGASKGRPRHPPAPPSRQPLPRPPSRQPGASVASVTPAWRQGLQMRAASDPSGRPRGSATAADLEPGQATHDLEVPADSIRTRRAAGGLAALGAPSPAKQAPIGSLLGLTPEEIAAEEAAEAEAARAKGGGGGGARAVEEAAAAAARAKEGRRQGEGGGGGEGGGQSGGGGGGQGQALAEKLMPERSPSCLPAPSWPRATRATCTTAPRSGARERASRRSGARRPRAGFIAEPSADAHSFTRSRIERALAERVSGSGA